MELVQVGLLTTTSNMLDAPGVPLDKEMPEHRGSMGKVGTTASVLDGSDSAAFPEKEGDPSPQPQAQTLNSGVSLINTL